jgi:hypothetical protein
VPYEHELMNVIYIDVSVNDFVLGNVLTTPLVNSVVYNLYQLILSSTSVKNSQNTFVIIGSDKDYLLWTRWKKCMLNLVNYKYASATEWLKCKHVFPLKLYNFRP